MGSKKGDASTSPFFLPLPAGESSACDVCWALCPGKYLAYPIHLHTFAECVIRWPWRGFPRPANLFL